MKTFVYFLVSESFPDVDEIVGTDCPDDPQDELARDMTDGVLVAERVNGEEKRPDRKPKPVAGGATA